MNEILIYDDIGDGWFSEGVTAVSIKEQLDAFGETDQVVVRINSPGGDVFEGFAIYNLLKQHSAQIEVRIDGLAASAASIIAMAGDEIIMGEASMMMIHDPWTFALGDANEMLKVADTLEKIKDSIVVAYVAKTGLDAKLVSDLMTDETWLTAESAVEEGFADSIEGQSDIQDGVMDRKWIRNAPNPQQEPEPRAAPEFRIAARKRLSAL